MDEPRIEHALYYITTDNDHAWQTTDRCELQAWAEAKVSSELLMFCRIK